MADSEAVQFCALLRRLRLEAGVSQEVLAERSSVSVHSISALERGARRAPYRATLSSLATALGLSHEQHEEFIESASRSSNRRRCVVELRGLPSFSTSFVGRERECRELRALAKSARLITICGFGGVGKTRTAAEVARSLADRSVVFVDLVALAEDDLVPARIAAIAGLHIAPGAGAPELAKALGARRRWLVLDNCEHLIEGIAHIVEALLRACPEIRVLATSREPLLVDGEALYRLEPLEPEGAGTDLFIDRAALSTSGSTIERRVAATIVRRVDGIPLAIELAAALTRLQSADAIVELLDRNPLSKAARRRTVVEHHRTMHDAISWSYALLNDAERWALRNLAFPDAGIARDHADALVRDAMLVQRLIDVSLASSGRAARRIWLHEMLRQFARDVAPANERADTAHRYARSLGASLDRAAERAWSDGSYAPLLLLGVELDNVRQCLRFGFASGAPATALAVLRAPDYWTAIGRAPEGFVWFARARAQFGTERGDEDDALLLFGLSMCAAQSGRADAAIEPSRRAAERAAACGLMVIAARSHIVLGNALLFSGDARAAVVALEEAVTRFEGLDDSTGLPRALTFAAMALLECDRVAEAARAVARAHEVRAWFRKDADPSDLLLTDSVEIELARLRGDRGEVIERARRAVTRRAHGPTTSAHLRVMRQLVDGLIADGRRGEATDFGIREAAALRERGFETDAALLLARTEA